MGLGLVTWGVEEWGLGWLHGGLKGGSGQRETKSGMGVSAASLGGGLCAVLSESCLYS